MGFMHQQLIEILSYAMVITVSYSSVFHFFICTLISVTKVLFLKMAGMLFISHYSNFYLDASVAWCRKTIYILQVPQVQMQLL
jgi:hypothetical protein